MDHHFDVEDAKTHGVEKAVILYNLKYWIRHNLANGVHRHDNHTWTYNSAEAFAELFPYFNAQKIARMLRQLEESGIIISGKYNLAGYDQTKWYAFVDEETVFQGQFSNLNNGISNSERPIPDTKPDINKEGGTNNVEPTSKPEAPDPPPPGMKKQDLLTKIREIRKVYADYFPSPTDGEIEQVIAVAKQYGGKSFLSWLDDAVKRKPGKPLRFLLEDYGDELRRAPPLQSQEPVKCVDCGHERPPGTLIEWYGNRICKDCAAKRRDADIAREDLEVV